jgi:hypothetical protein
LHSLPTEYNNVIELADCSGYYPVNKRLAMERNGT